MVVGTRIPVQAERQECAGQAGHCDAAVQDGDIRQRLFLAWARRLRQVRDAEKQHRLLAEQDRTQQSTRPTELRHPSAKRLAGDSTLGVPTDKTKHREHHAADRCRPESQLSSDSEDESTTQKTENQYLHRETGIN